jgi:hypothetical protein
VIIIDDDEALNTVGVFFGQSEPGATLSHLILVREGRSKADLPEPQSYIYAIDACHDNARENEEFIAKTLYVAAHEPDVGPPLLAVFTMELIHVPDVDLDEVAENRARVLHHNGRLDEHPQAVEATRLYAAAADGRRWTGMHWLTGPRSGDIEGPTFWDRGSRGPMDTDWPFARMIRRTVGLLW